jgi:hypothetical protein
MDFLDSEAPLFTDNPASTRVKPKRLYVFDVVKDGTQVDLKKFRDYETAQHQWQVMQNFRS